MPKINLDALGTEQRNPNTMNLDELTIDQALQRMNTEDQKVAIRISQKLDSIGEAIATLVESWKKGGRIIYIGAGTSGRLGVLDAVECPPTFGTPSDRVMGLIAGGDKAFIAAVEGAEDSKIMAIDDLKRINLTDKDSVVGIAASGRTPYVIGGLEYANQIGANTISIACNLNAEISQYAKHSIEVDLDPEFLTGSTRLKSGTAQKLILNMLSTVTMIQVGKVYKNLMVDVRPTNDKLIERSKRIIMLATGVDYQVAQEYYLKANESVKLAIVMILTDTDANTARQKLDQANGFVRKAIL
ncbi:MAG: N-acetylmuramic acid 6-phosphate etherase [Bifidobacteriaceae bacterium]|jgi:N-acetylmuramic acid 6-phosphate etherase|nr:N-acetylmuramic acid 6-phosphate etherase [Bifidobacteriaceae bacterium]